MTQGCREDQMNWAPQLSPQGTVPTATLFPSEPSSQETRVRAKVGKESQMGECPHTIPEERIFLSQGDIFESASPN